jgi:predicted MFS family arabinose efflux permease
LRAGDRILAQTALPTFSGGSVVAFGLSASIFSMLLYLVLYLQDILGYSPLATGARLMVISGMIVGGVGVGVVNPPLASTAVGVVPPQRAGMASGINSTFRQVGIATGIALLGTLFSNNVKDEVLARVAAVPGLSRSGRESPRRCSRGRSGT